MLMMMMRSFAFGLLLSSRSYPPQRSRPAVALLTENADANAVAAALTPNERELVVALQTHLCISDADTVKLLIRHSEVLGYSFESKIAPTVEALKQALELTDADVGKLVVAAPSALGLSLEATLRPRLATLGSQLSLQPGELGALVLKYPNLLTLRVEARIRALASLLMLSRDELRRLVVRYPQVLSLSAEENVTPTIHALNALLRGPGEASDAVGADVRALVLRLPTILGLNVPTNLRPKIELLGTALDLAPHELRAAVVREPAALGASLEKSLQPNIELWRAALPAETALSDVVRKRGLRFLTCNAEKRTLPRLRRAVEAGVAPVTLVARMRMTDVAFEDWIRGAGQRPAGKTLKVEEQQR